MRALATVLPTVIYGDVVYGGAPLSSRRKVNLAYNNIVRFVAGGRRYDHVTNDAIRLRLPHPEKLGNLHLNKLTQKIVHGVAPSYLTQSTTLLSDFNSRTGVILRIPQHSHDVFRRSFSYRSAASWNKLPKFIRNESNLTKFDTLSRSFLSFYPDLNN